MKRIVVGLLSIFVVCFYSNTCIGNEMQGVEHDPKDKTEKTKRVEKKVGPFEIGKKRFVVIEDVTEREGNIIACNSFEIKDEAGTSFYKKTLGPYEDSTTVIEGIFKLEGKSGEGLILYFDTAPSAPPSGKSFQIFGVVKGNLKPLSQPVNVYGQMESLPKGKSRDSIRLFKGDVIKIKLWKGLIGLVVPLDIDFQKLMISPLKKEGIFDIYFITAPDKPVKLPGSFYLDHNVNAKVENIDATKGMNVEFLNAYAEVQLKQNGSVDIDVSNLWLKVKINGREGWINDLNDFNMLGLPPID